MLPALEPVVMVAVVALALVAVTVALAGMVPMLVAPAVVELVGLPVVAPVTMPEPVWAPPLVVDAGSSELHPSKSAAPADQTSQCRAQISRGFLVSTIIEKSGKLGVSSR